MRKTVVILVVALAVVTAPVLFAHMALSKSMPAADAVVATKPAAVQLWFSQAPDKAVSKLAVTGPSGAVTLGELTVGADKSLSAAVKGDMPNGAYTVAWQAAGDDGHVQKGTFSFSMQQTR